MFARLEVRMDCRAMALTLARWFLIAAGGQVLFLIASGTHPTIFDFDADDWKLIVSSGVIALVGGVVDFLQTSRDDFGLVRKTDEEDHPR